jgi:catechol 2,3-dioxygenase-like lactoylglutathione lyase family enzyme
MKPVTATLGAFVLGSPTPRRLAEFYRKLLGWVETETETETETEGNDGTTFVRLRDPERERPGLSFQLEPEHVPPVWPPSRGHQQMQGHLDVLVDDLDAEAARAIALGATRQTHQPGDGVVVLRDPDGHPFCLFLPGS